MKIPFPFNQLIRLTTIASLSVGIALGAIAETGVANVRDFGAQSDGQTDDTDSIRKAIDAVPKNGAWTSSLSVTTSAPPSRARRNVTFKGDSRWDYRGDSDGASRISPVRADLACLFETSQRRSVLNRRLRPTISVANVSASCGWFVAAATS